MPMFELHQATLGPVPRNWIAVASADHGRRGRDEMTLGFMQVCHGKCAPLKCLQPGDRVPHRRQVACVPANKVPIQPLLDRFKFVEDRPRWGHKFHFDLFAISDHDMALIDRGMGASRAALGWSDSPKAAFPLPLSLAVQLAA